MKPTMRATNRFESLLLFIGDVVLFGVALWIALFVRHLELPSMALLNLHVLPFIILFAAWVLVFFIVGLYDRHTRLIKSALPVRVVRAQIINIIIAALFFFFVPYFGITPKTILAIYLVVSTVLIILWRLYAFPFLNVGSRRPALLIGGGHEFKELLDEVNDNPRYHINFISSIDVDSFKDGGGLSEKIFHELRRSDISVVVLNAAHRKIKGILPHLYKPLYSNVQFIDANELYEDIFERVPLDSIDHVDGFSQLPSVSVGNNSYDIARRIIDLVMALILGAFSLAFYPFVALAIRLDDGGPLFIKQERVGKDMARIYLYKFRSMTHSDDGEWVKDGGNTVTRVGKYLRATRIDELPQIWNVLRGDLSFVGPRPDIIGLYKKISENIPLYDLRYTVKPGLSGWAQVKQWYDEGNISPQSMEETYVRLQYDVYYIKNRSLMLDMIIMLRTIKIFLTRSGS